MNIEYDPPGPQAAAFHASDAFVRGLMGPVGSGKSTSMCVEVLKRALEQKPSADGCRRSRWVFIRNTFSELLSTTLRTWADWMGDLQVTKLSPPITSTVSIPDLGDGTSLHLEVILLAIDRPEDAAKLKSLEVTGAFLNEASELDPIVLAMATQRVGRYPSMHLHGGPSWSGVIMDTNPPSDDSAWYHLAEEERPEGYEFFRQPGGLYRVADKRDPEYGKLKPNPLAENIKNLVGGHTYYLKQVGGKTPEYIEAFLLGNYAATMKGKPVWHEFNETLHVSKNPLMPIPGLPIVIGFDFGLTPSAVILQISPRAQAMILDEVVCENAGIRQAYEEHVLPLLNHKYKNYRIEAVGDPSGVSRSDTDMKSVFEELEEMGMICEPASTNKFIPRREAVAYFLQRLTSSGPGMLIDPGCKKIIKAMRGGYRYDRVQVSGSAQFKDRPTKDMNSHVSDALQYACLALRGDNAPAVAQPVKQVSWA